MDTNDEIKEKFIASIKESLKNMMSSFNKLPIELKQDQYFIIETLKIVKENEKYAGQYEDFVPHIIQYLTINKEVALNLVNSHGYLLCRLPERFKDDEEVVLAAIHSYPFALVYASEKSKDNKKLVLEAVKMKPDILEVASSRLCEDEEIALIAVKKDGKAINFVSSVLWSNREIMLEAVKTNMWALQYLGKNLINDKEIALEAYKCDKYAMQYFSEELKNELKDKDVIPYLKSTFIADQLHKELSESKLQVKKIKI